VSSISTFHDAAPAPPDHEELNDVPVTAGVESVGAPGGTHPVTLRHGPLSPAGFVAATMNVTAAFGVPPEYVHVVIDGVATGVVLLPTYTL
jgi:hypothetical protein